VVGRRLLADKDQIRICNLICMFRLEPDSTFSVEKSVAHADSSDPDLATQPSERLRALLDISNALRGTLDADVILDQILGQLFRVFPQAERGLVVFREEPTASIVVRAHRTPNGEAADPHFSSSVVRRCLENCEAILGNDLPEQFPESDSIAALPGASLIIAPLWQPGGAALGAVQLESRSDRRKFTPEDLTFLLGAASQASVAISNARFHRDSLLRQRKERDFEDAKQVQRSLLPHSLPVVPGYQFFAHYDSAQIVGGDYYDFVPLSGGRLAVLLGDVAGKGVSAALVMAKFSVEARVCFENHADPAEAILRLNRRMVESPVPDKFVTLAGLVLDPAAHRAVVVNAGHPSPLVLRANGAVENAADADSSGLPIGVADLGPYPSREIHLEPGDRLLVFSDGVSEAMDYQERQFGIASIPLACRGADCCKSAVMKLVEAVRKHAAGCPQSDDIAVVCFGRGP
jgi:serine phosphatase RsbU (regulator of sigma subunit)